MFTPFAAALTAGRAGLVALIALVVGTSSPFAATAAAQGPIAISEVWAGAYNMTSPPGVFGPHLTFHLHVTSVNPVASVTATFAGRSVPLQYDGIHFWHGDDMATASLPFGPTPIEFRATDVLGNSVATQLTLTHDNPPSVEILAPQPDVLARPSVRVHARCTDDGGPCQLRIDGVPGVSGTNEIDQAVSLETAQNAYGDDMLSVRATDSAGQQALERRRVWIEPSPRLSLVATYPGLVQDIDTGRALVFTNEAPRRALIVDRLTGATQEIFTEQAPHLLREGQLTPSGALFTTSEHDVEGDLYEWTPDALVPLGRVVNLEQFVGRIRVEGPWALFSRQGDAQNPGYDLVRRDLRSGTEVVLLDGTLNPSRLSDLAANGDVIFERPNGFKYDLVRYRSSVFEPLIAAASSFDGARTDGTVVTYAVSFGQAYSCRARTPDGDHLVADHAMGFGSDLRAQEGWAACRMPFSPFQIWSRGPSGARQSFALTDARIDAVGGDGALLYHVPPGSSASPYRYLRRGNLPAVDVGRGKWPVQRLDGIWYVIAGPHLFRIAGLQSLLSEGATGPFFDLDIALLNPTSTPASTDTYFLKEGGDPIFRHRSVPSHSRYTIRVDQDEPDVASAAASTIVYSPTPLVVERTMTWDASGYGGHSGAAVDGARRRWLFAEGAQGYFDTFILLVNNEVGPATVQLTFLVELGATVTRQITVAGRSRVTVHAGSIPELVNRSFATIVDASGPIAAERAMYFGASPLWTGGHESAGVPEPATRWFHAEGATGTVFDTFILLANPGTETANVVVRFLTAAGATVTRALALPPLSRRTIDPETVGPQLANASFATAVESDLPIVSERAMYWSTIGGPWQEAHNSFGVTTTGTKWGTADGRAGGPRGYQTYVLVANTSTTATAKLVATFMRSDGAQITRTLDVGPSRRRTIDCNEIPELANAEFGVVIESTNAVPIVVERATYWSAGGVFWAGGTNVTATPVP